MIVDIEAHRGIGKILGPSTRNIYLEDKLLVNYPGKTEFPYYAGDINGGGGYGIPSKYELYEITSYTDRFGHSWLVFSAFDGEGGWVLCRIIGRQVEILHTFETRYDISFVHHNGHLIILPSGSYPLVWDGLNGVVALGCREVPAPPVAHLKAIYSEYAVAQEESMNGGVWASESSTWMQGTDRNHRPVNGLAINTRLLLDNTTQQIAGLYSWVVQYVDHLGNKSPPSAPSNILTVPHYEEQQHVDGGVKYALDKWACVDWSPVASQPNVSAVYVGRSRSLNDTGVTTWGTFWLEQVYQGSTMARHTSQIDDAALVLREEIDTGILPPPVGARGFSWGGRLFIYDSDDRSVLWWSDKGYPGQFRLTQMYRARATIKYAVGAGDRVYIVTEIGTEVLYEGQDAISFLEVITSISSDEHSGFVSYSGSIYGFFSGGFGVITPEGFKTGPRLEYERIWNAFIHKGRYIARAVVDGDDVLVVYDIEHDSMFLLTEDVRFACSHRGNVWGTGTTLYELFAGSYPAAIIEVKEFWLPGGAEYSCTLVGMRIRASSDALGYVSLTSERPEQDLDMVSIGRTLIDSDDHTVDAPRPRWRQHFSYASNHRWSSTRPFVWAPNINHTPQDTALSFDISLPAGNLIKIEAVVLDINVQGESARPA